MPFFLIFQCHWCQFIFTSH